MPALTQFRLPDPLAHWPWPRTLNPHYAEVKLECDAWLRGFEALDAKSQRSFDRCNFGKYTYCFISVFLDDISTPALLGGLAYPLIDKG